MLCVLQFYYFFFFLSILRSNRARAIQEEQVLHELMQLLAELGLEVGQWVQAVAQQSEEVKLAPVVDNGHLHDDLCTVGLHHRDDDHPFLRSGEENNHDP